MTNGRVTILTERAPALATPLRLFLLGVTSLFALLGISIWKAPLLALDYVRNSATVSVTHLFTLGFGGLILSGALYQLTPVVLHSQSPRVTMVNLHLALQSIGLAGLVIGFLQSESLWLIGGGSLIVIGGAIFAAWSWPSIGDTA